MNYSTIVFLINKNVRAILATYEADEKSPREMFKTLDPELAVGDLIIVPTITRHGMTVCKVVEVDVEVDFDATVQVKWVVGKVEKTAYEQTISQEGVAIQTIKSAEARKKREELRASILADSVEDIKALPISVMNGDAPGQPKTTGNYAVTSCPNS